MKKFKKGLIIGPDGIGQAHIREFINYGINEISILRKNIFKNKEITNQKKKTKVKFNFLKTINEIKKFKPEIISICSPHYLHIRHLKKISTFFPKPIIIEKPFLVTKDMNFKKIEKISNEINNYLKGRLFVNIPMIELTKQIKRIFKFREIKQIKFKYLTKGKHTNDEILIDLLPHAVSFVLSLQEKKKIKFDLKKFYLNKNKSKIFTVINGTFCEFYLEQNINLKKSLLSFEINKKKFKRIILVKDKIHKNYILYNKKKYEIKNPLTLSLKKSIKSLNLNLNNNINRIYVSLINKFTCHVIKEYRKNIK